MNRKWQIVIGILCVVGVATPLVVAPIVLSIPLVWSVTVGDEILYSVSVGGWELNASVYHQQVPTYLMAYDRVNITAIIADLPELGFYVNGDEFQRQVGGYEKVRTEFSNGSDIPWQLGNVVNSIISESLLPTGSWELIDWFYPNSPPSRAGYQSLYAYTGTTSFHFGFNGFDIDLTTMLRSDISFDTGVASRISYFRSHGVDYAFNITLTQIGN